jgi:hypothetical protein
MVCVAVAGVVGVGAGVGAGTGCTRGTRPGAEQVRALAERVTLVHRCAAQEATPVPLRGDLTARAELSLRCYRAGLVAWPAGAPHAVFVIGSGAPCRPLPEARPADFEVHYHRRGRELDPRSPRYALAAATCHFEWSLLHLQQPTVQCRRLGAGRFDAFYRRLQALKLHEVRVRELKHFSPHRGGPTLVLKWKGARCDLADALMFQVEEVHRPAFDAAVTAFREVFALAQEAPPSTPR